MLTNFATIRKAVRKMISIDKLMRPILQTNLSKKERLHITRERQKLEKHLGSIADLNRLPSAIFVVDILKEQIAVAEARKLNIPTFAIVDTNSDPNLIDFPIPANDDASKSIDLIIKVMVQAIDEGLAERKFDKDARAAEEEEKETAEQLIAKSKTIEEFEAVEDEEEAAKQKRLLEGPVKMKKLDEEAPPRYEKRPRKTLAKPKK